MQLLPSFVRGYMIAKSVGRLLWVNNSRYFCYRYYTHNDDIALLSYRSSSFRYGNHRYKAMRFLCNNGNEFATTVDFQDDKDIGAVNVHGNDDDDDDDGASEHQPTQPQQRQQQQPHESNHIPIWNHPVIQARVARKKENNKLRFRQHVNPLSRMYQQPTILPDQWPSSVYTIVAERPLHLDIGCGKGGFLIDLCQSESTTYIDSGSTGSRCSYNYLGLEIRPGVATYAKDRIAVHQLQGRLDFLGCNANVDLDRVLNLYQSHYCGTSITATEAAPNIHDVLCLHRVTIQFPDPHFKSQHMKRRVVTKTLVDTIAKYMPTNGTIVLQSDIQSVLDDMRRQFREATAVVATSKELVGVQVENEVYDDRNNNNERVDDSNNNNDHVVDGNQSQSTNMYFIDSITDVNEYIAENSLGVPTEREQSVLVQGLPVYRSLLSRSDCPYWSKPC